MRKALILLLVFCVVLYGAYINGSLTIEGNLIFEGSTADGNETTVAVTDPTADRTWTIPDGSDTFAGLSLAQTFATGLKTVTSKFDFGGGTLEVPNSNTLPGTCAVGDSYMDTDATSGQRWYLCESTNTWVLQGGSGGGANAYLFNFALGHGTAAGNWNTSSLPPGCFTSTVPVGTGGTNLSAGTGIWTDADTEVMECRIGRIPADVTLTNITLEYDGQQLVNGVADYSLDFDWYCVAAGDTFFASYVDPPTPVLITGTGVATIATNDYMGGSATGVDLTQDSSGCAVGQLLVVKFSRASSDSSTNDLRVMSLRAYTPAS